MEFNEKSEWQDLVNGVVPKEKEQVRTSFLTLNVAHIKIHEVYTTIKKHVAI